MKHLVRFLTFQLIFLFLTFVIPAQKPKAKQSVADTSNVFEVRLPLTITDLKKKLIICQESKEKKTDKDKTQAGCFNKNDFIVLENGVRQKINFFTDNKTNPPVYVGVLMDTSPSTAGKMTFSKRVASDFLYTVVRLRKDKAAFMTFDDKINLLQDFTDKLDLLDRAVDKVKNVGSQTALYDAIWQFSDEKLRNMPGRRVIVVITDGDDTFSRANLNDAIDIAQRTETTIFGISTKENLPGKVPDIKTEAVKDKSDNYLTRLCEETGGEAFFVSDLYALEKAFKKISETFRSQYVITYRPKNQRYDGRKRRIEVRFKRKNNADKFKIRSKTEYRSVRDTLK